jgi:hypothetical protein
MFFPDVGIQPVTDGGLFAAALFVSELLDMPSAASPREFLETVAFTNWAKFTVSPVSTGRVLNRDYADVGSKLAASVPFVVTELAVLQPGVALVPKAIWQRPLLQAAMRGASPFTRFIPVPQFNATVVNCHLESFAPSAARLKRRFAGESLAEWMKNLYGFRENHAWRYLGCLEKIISETVSKQCAGER